MGNQADTILRVAVGIFATAVFAAPVSAQVQKFAPTRQTVVDSDGRKFDIRNSTVTVVAANKPRSALHWLSNAELMFVSTKNSNRPKESGNPALNYRLLVWNIDKETLEIIREFGTSEPRICSNNGYALIRVRRPDGGFDILHGEPKALQEDASNKSYSDVFCRPTAEVPSAPSWTKDRWIVWLERLGDGFLDFGERKSALDNSPIKLYRNGANEDQSIELPLRKREVTPRFQYFRFKDAFFVNSSFRRHPPPANLPYPVYWLYRDGTLEKILNLPWGSWRSAGSFWLVPSNIGVILISHNFNVRDERDLAHAGIYVFDGERSRRLLKAWIETTAVSPDGCRLAFSYAPVVTQKDNVLQVMNLCSGG